MEDHRSDAELLRDPRIYRLVVEATIEGEKRGYSWGNEAGYVLGRSVGFTEGYETHKDETQAAWEDAWLTNEELQLRHQDWMAAGAPEDPQTPDLRPLDLPL